LAVALVTSGYFGGMAMLQPGVFAVLGIEPRAQGDLAGQLGATQEVTFLVLTGVFGVLSDRFGRRWVYAGGLAVAAVGYVMFPLAGSTAGLFLWRFVFGVGGAAMTAMMVTLVADYAGERHRGRMNGIQGFVMVLGAFVPFVVVQVPVALVKAGHSQAEAQGAAFAIMAGLGVVAALIAAFGLARSGGTGPGAAGALATGARRSFAAIARDGLGAARDGRIALSYGAAFTSRGDLAVTGAFMILWASQTARAELGLDIAGAQKVAGNLMLMTILGALAGALFTGFVADRISRVTAVALSSGLGCLVYLTMGLVRDPLGGAVKGILLIMGVAELSAFVTSQALVGERAPANRRGAVIGFFGAAGAAGMLVGTFVGGKLFRHVGPWAPFILFGVLNGVVTVWALVVRARVGAGAGQLSEAETSPLSPGEAA
jgi:MFS family permease